VYSDWEDVTSSGRAFQVFGPATGKARLPTVDQLGNVLTVAHKPLLKRTPEWSGTWKNNHSD